MNPYITTAQFQAMYDIRVTATLSNDQNSNSVAIATVQFMLDMQASELDSFLNGRFTLPITPPQIPASGIIALTAIPADNSTITISDGFISVTFTFLSGGVATNQVNTASGNTATIAGIFATVIGKSGLNIAAGENGNAVSLVNKLPGVAGNVAMTTTSAALTISGMAGGEYQMPLILTKWVGVTAAARMYARRNDRPKGIDADVAAAMQWRADIIAGIIGIPGVPFANVPILQDSNFPQGQSEFDYVFGSAPSPTGTSGPGNVQ